MTRRNGKILKNRWKSIDFERKWGWSPPLGQMREIIEKPQEIIGFCKEKGVWGQFRPRRRERGYILIGNSIKPLPEGEGGVVGSMAALTR